MKGEGMFDKIGREYPNSPLAEEAKIWAGVLQVIEKLKQVDIDIEERRKSCRDRGYHGSAVC